MTSDLQHRLNNAEHDAFGITDDKLRCEIEDLVEEAREELRSFTCPDLNEAWTSLFEAEAAIDRWNIAEAARRADKLANEAGCTTFGGAS